MKRYWKRAVLFGTITCSILFAGCGKKEDVPQSSVVEEIIDPITLNLWYTDEALEGYLTESTAKFTEEKGISVTLHHTSLNGYLESINERNIQGQEMVDVYLLNTDHLEEAYRAGLAEEVPEEYMAIDYPEAARTAVQYQEKQIAYPLFYQTTFFLYNKNFVEEPPASFESIMQFAETYGMEEGSTYEGIEYLLKWDVNDIFYNYGFFGAYFNIGGVNGDDRSQIGVDTPETEEALVFFKRLNQSLYFDSADVSYDTVIQDFLNGKILYTIAGTQSLSTLEASEFAYGIAPLPAMDGSLESRQAATHMAAVVNPYSADTSAAAQLAHYITNTSAENLYAGSGYLPCKGMEQYPTEEFIHVQEAYEKSVSLPKLMGISNLWALLEVAVNNIWNAELPEEAVGDIISAESQEENEGEAEERMRQTREEIRKIVAEQLNSVQEQIKLQLENKEE